jgi:hypothetical protein
MPSNHMAETPTTTEPRRRWYQFRLRTLLIAVALLAVPCSYIAGQYRIVGMRRAWLVEQLDPNPRPTCPAAWTVGDGRSWQSCDAGWAMEKSRACGFDLKAR